MDSLLLKPFWPIYRMADILSDLLGTTQLDSLFVVILIPRKWYKCKLFYMLICGTMAVGIQHGVHIVHPLLSGVYGYLFINFTSVYLCPWIMLFTSFSHLLLLTSVFPPDYGTSWNAAPGYMLLQMMITLKLSSVPFNLLDAYELTKDEETKKKFKKRMGRDAKIHEEFAVYKKPGILEYFSFVMHFQTIGCGPVDELSKYLEFVADDKKGKIPFDLKGFLVRFSKANFFLMMYSFIKDYVVDCVYFKEKVIDKTDSLPYYVFATYIGILNTRFRLYTGLFFAETSCVGSGLGYTGLKNGKYTWENVRTSNFDAFEFGISMRVLMNNWNVGIQKWLRYYIYNRVVFKIRLFRMLCPMIVSALWHGIYMGYFVMWISLTFLNLMYIEIYKTFPRLVDRKKLGWPMYLICWTVMNLFLSHFTVGFILIYGRDVWGYYKKFYFGGHLLCLTVLLVLKWFPRRKLSNRVDTKKDKTK